jgi:high-affinity Fe2+/Pb2+ permease
VMGIVAPPASAGIPRRVGGVVLLILAVILAIVLGWAIVQLVALPFGGIGTGVSFFWGFLLVCVVLGGLILFGRRRQKRARERAAEQRASQFKR